MHRFHPSVAVKDRKAKSMLTYETIRKIVSEERSNSKLCRLPEDFFKEVKGYLEIKGHMTERKEDQWEYESTKRLIQDLLEMRERKILNLAMFHTRSGMVSEDLTKEEAEFFSNVVRAIKEFHEKRKREVEGEPEDLELIAVLKPTEKFVGTNLKEYGPFKEGDIATLPKENARLLVDRRFARKLVLQ